MLDVFSRRVVGWSMANHLRTEIVLNALNMALARRRPKQVVHHSDRGAVHFARLWQTMSRSRAGCPSGARPDLWEPWVGNHPRPPGRQKTVKHRVSYGERMLRLECHATSWETLLEDIDSVLHRRSSVPMAAQKSCGQIRTRCRIGLSLGLTYRCDNPYLFDNYLKETDVRCGSEWIGFHNRRRVKRHRQQD